MGVASFKGDTKKLLQLALRIRQLQDFPKQLNRALAEETLGLVQEGFEQGKSPYGKRWQPLRSRPGGRPLRDTGRLMNSLVARVSKTGFEVRTNVRYAAVHNYGAVIKAKSGSYLRFRVGGARSGKGSWVAVKQVTIPQRQFLPGKKLPPAYAREYRAVARAQMKRAMRGGR